MLPINSTEVKVTVFDATTDEDLESTLKNIYVRIHAVIFVYDATSMNSFEWIRDWYLPKV